MPTLRNVTIFSLFIAITGLQPAAAAEEPEPRLGLPPEVVVIGVGEMMDALHRAVEEQVEIINEDGGVMKTPLKLTRIAKGCADRQKAGDAPSSAEGRVIIAFADYCEGSGLSEAQTFAEGNILIMGVGDWPDSLTEDRSGPTVFRLGQRLDRAAQELAFAFATAKTDRIAWIDRLPASNFKAASFADVQRQLDKGFQATGQEQNKWGAFLPKQKIEFVDVTDDDNPFESLSDETMLFVRAAKDDAREILGAASESGWRGHAILDGQPMADASGLGGDDWLKSLPEGIEVSVFQRQRFYIGDPPQGAKDYTAFHPDWVAGFWQVMKSVKYATSFDGREPAGTFGGPPFFSRAPWIMLQSRSRYAPPELRQRFNDNGDLRMPAFELKKIWPK